MLTPAQLLRRNKKNKKILESELSRRYPYALVDRLPRYLCLASESAVPDTKAPVLTASKPKLRKV
jgi:hypothetical protein